LDPYLSSRSKEVKITKTTGQKLRNIMFWELDPLSGGLLEFEIFPGGLRRYVNNSG
jgi:hypothetical protein